jgi:hypothetical protein
VEAIIHAVDRGDAIVVERAVAPSGWVHRPWTPTVGRAALVTGVPGLIHNLATKASLFGCECAYFLKDLRANDILAGGFLGQPRVGLAHRGSLR